MIDFDAKAVCNIMGVPYEALISLVLSIARQLAPILQWW
jgi:hypothetical protein